MRLVLISLGFFLVTSFCTSTVECANPVPYGRITSVKGWRKDPFGSGKMKYHRGYDIAVASGTPINPTRPGYVYFSGWNKSYGWLVVVDHRNGYYTLYGHNSKNLVSTGQFVTEQTKIALIGSTGRSTGPHLHYEIRYWPQATATVTSRISTLQHR